VGGDAPVTGRLKKIQLDILIYYNIKMLFHKFSALLNFPFQDNSLLAVWQSSGKIYSPFHEDNRRL
jgi:hypothetical protein